MKTYLKDLTPDEVIRRLNAGLANYLKKIGTIGK